MPPDEDELAELDELELDELEELDEPEELDEELLVGFEPLPTPPQAASNASPLARTKRLKKVAMRTGTPARHCCYRDIVVVMDRRRLTLRKKFLVDLLLNFRKWAGDKGLFPQARF